MTHAAQIGPFLQPVLSQAGELAIGHTYYDRFPWYITVSTSEKPPEPCAGGKWVPGWIWVPETFIVK
jgi:hypothetical protein